jgi:very-short-patch-repair endonuclease
MTVARARQLRRDATDAERRLWSKLRLGQMDGFKFRRQAPIGRYIADFACYAPRPIVEIDGSQHAEDAAYDSKRTAWFESQGFAVIRFWNNGVLGHTDMVFESVRQTLRHPAFAAAEASPPTLPSPTRGEGAHLGNK